MRFEFDGVNPDGGANWDTWQENLVDFVPRLFRHVSDHRPSPGHTRLTGSSPAAGRHHPTPFVTADGFVTFETTTDFADAQHVTVWANVAPAAVGCASADPRRRPLAGDRRSVEALVLLLPADRGPGRGQDVSNPTRVTTEPTWSTFLIPGPGARLLSDVPAGRGGKVESMTYPSTVAGQDRTALVWTPPGYDPGRAQPYPVLYLQHGGGQNYTDWVEMGRAKQILDHQYLDGDLTPMVVVMGNGNSSDFNRELRENIVPTARARYHVSSDPSKQALAGLSMGGGQALGVLKAYPGEFAYVAAFSAGFGSGTGVNVEAINSGTTMLRVYVGDQTDFVYPSFMAGLTTMNNLGIRYEFDGVTPGRTAGTCGRRTSSTSLRVCSSARSSSRRRHRAQGFLPRWRPPAHGCPCTATPKGTISMKRRRILATVAMLAAGSGLVACSSDEGGSDASNCTNTITKQNVPVVTMWGWYPNTQLVVDNFNKLHDDVQVCWTNVGQGSDEYDKFQTAISAGTGAPDVIMVEADRIPTFQIQGALVDIKQYGFDAVKANYGEGAWKDVSVGDKVYGVPVDGGPAAMIYRKDIFDKYKITPPKTWAEYEQAAQKVKDAGGPLFGDFGANVSALTMALQIQKGASPFTYDPAQPKSIGVKLNDQASKDVLDYWGGLAKKGLVGTQDQFTPSTSPA
ncbi:extracellular solute-binding protein [Micromonospora sp. M12]